MWIYVTKLSNQEEFRTKKDDALHVKWRDYDKASNIWIDKPNIL